MDTILHYAALGFVIMICTWLVMMFFSFGLALIGALFQGAIVIINQLILKIKNRGWE